MERMGHVTYEFGYQVALECLRAKYSDLYVEEDPFVDYPENTNVQIEGIVAASIVAMVASWNLATFGGRPSGARVEASFANASACEVGICQVKSSGMFSSEMKSTIVWVLITVLGCIVAEVSSADEFAAFSTGAPGEVVGPHPRVAIGSRAAPVRVRPPAVLLGRFVVVV
ncbi:hypothetical protein BHE74_00028305 [Ensete ventricosum]|nr:hypothetical protein BHE74_00028305 [Ensete ventricosum]RZS04670.1 hypothetical protein BHM03_00035032 [Ensete ventricosum]